MLPVFFSFLGEALIFAYELTFKLFRTLLLSVPSIQARRTIVSVAYEFTLKLFATFNDCCRVSRIE
jgi:hypothetical protein